MAHPKDGGLMKTYAALSWIILRLYALAFLGLAYIAVQWLDVANPLLATLSFGFDPLRAIVVLAFVGTFLLLPPPYARIFTHTTQHHRRRAEICNHRGIYLLPVAHRALGAANGVGAQRC